MYVSVAIPTYKRPKYIIDALKSVLFQKTNFSYEILILDNACDPSLKNNIEKQAEETSIPIHYFPIPEIGLHNGRNTAALVAKGEIIVYIDDDIIAPQGWLQALCDPFQDTTVQGVGGKTIPQWEATPPDWIHTLSPAYFSLLDQGDEIQEMKYPQTPYGCNMAYRRSLILKLGGFPPDGVGGGKIEWHRGDGETGFGYKVYENKYKIIYTGKGWLYHRIPQQRLTLNYVRSRTMKGAISRFYTQIRKNHFSSFTLMKQSVKNLIKFLIYKLIILALILFPLDKRIKYEIQSTYYGVTGLYQMRLAFDEKLRQWVKQEDYLSSLKMLYFSIFLEKKS